MSEKISNIAKNTSYFTFALILQKIISFSYFILIARALGPADLGKYYFAISFTTIFAIFIDFGLANVLTREVAKTKSMAQDLLNSVLAIKIPLTVLSLLSAIVLINLLGYSQIIKQLVYLSAICMILDSFTLTFFAVIRGFHNLLFESIASVIFQLIVLFLGLTILRLGLGLNWLMAALVTASVFNFFYSSTLIKRKWKLRLNWILFFQFIRKKADLALIKLIIKITIPFGLFAVFQKIYLYLDTVLLSILSEDKEVGLYQIAFKIIFALQFLPMAFMASLYPAFASYWTHNKKQLAVTFERAINYLIIISLPISVGIIVLADKIILIFKSDYTAAVLPLQIIMASLFFIFLNFPIGSLLNACEKQKINTINMAIVLTASVILNIILIPKLQTVGAAITVVITNGLMFVLGMRWIPSIIKYRPLKILSTFFKAAFAISIMATLILLLKPMLNVFVIIILAGFVYFIALFLLGGFKKEDVISIWKSLCGMRVTRNM